MLLALPFSTADWTKLISDMLCFAKKMHKKGKFLTETCSHLICVEYFNYFIYLQNKLGLFDKNRLLARNIALICVFSPDQWSTGITLHIQ